MSDLSDLLHRHVDERTAPGIVAALGDVTGPPEVAAAGDLGPDAIVRIQSMTKPVLAVATLRLVGAGELDLDDPVDAWLPELADRQVLRAPDADLDDTVPAERPITVRHLLTCTSGYGMILEDSPVSRAMRESGVEAGPAPVTMPEDDWLASLAGLPLVGQPGERWRYHHSFGILGVLLSRAVGRPLGDHLREDLFQPLGMVDTGYAVSPARADRLPAAYRVEGEDLVQTEPAAGGHYVSDDETGRSHGELVSTLGDYASFARMLAAGGVHEGHQVVEPELLRALRTDQVPTAAKEPDSFFPGFWESAGWGYGVAIDLGEEHRGRFGWSGGLGTDFWVDPATGRYAVLLTQVEMGPRAFRLLGELQQL